MVIIYKTQIVMKRIIAIIAAAALCLLTLSCSKDKLYPDGADMNSLRVALTPDPGVVPAAGADFESVVVVHYGPVLNCPWEVSVDGDPAWVSVQNKDITTQFTGTYAGDDTEVVQKGISCVVAPNLTGKKRTVNLRFTIYNGASIVYTLTQSAK